MGVRIGASTNGIFNGFVEPQPQVNANLKSLRRSGATIARNDAFWEAAEPRVPVDGVHRYNWAFADWVAGSLATSGLRWLPIIDYAAPWARANVNEPHSPPRSVTDYAAYAAAFAGRYGSNGSFWKSHPWLSPRPADTYEIWNEPDNGAFWSPTPDAGRYAALYLRAREAILAEDPHARVIVGGLTHPAAFLRSMVAAAPALRDHIDGVAIHPYAHTPEGVLRRVRNARLELRSLGLPDVPLYITEFGWKIGAARLAVSARLRSEYIAQTIAILGHTNCGIAAISLHTWVSAPNKRIDRFAIHPRKGGRSRGTAAFAAGIRRALTRRPELPIC